MSSSRRKADGKEGGATGSRGLFRAILAGPGRTLADAFANLEQAPQVERVWRHPKLFGVAYELQRAPRLVRQTWDVLLAGVVTEATVHRFGDLGP